MTKIVLKIIVFICFFSSLYSQTFQEIQKIVAPERINQTDFCSKIQFLENFAFLSQHTYKKTIGPGDTIFHSGIIYIYKLNNVNEWVLYQKIENPKTDRQFDNFGYDLKINSDFTLVVSSFLSYSDKNNIVYSYVKNQNDYWELKQEIVSPNSNYESFFGHNLAISGNYLAIGAYVNNTDENNLNPIIGTGAVFIYKKNSSDLWVIHQKLVAPQRKPYNRFGISIAINKTFLMIGMPYENYGLTNIQNMGTVFSYVLDENGYWIDHQKIIPSFREEDALFGSELTISDSVLVISCTQNNTDEHGANYIEKSGGVFIYELQGNGLWSESKKLLSEPRVAYQYFGSGISVQKDIVIVGSFREDSINENGQITSNKGAVYVFKKNQSNGWGFTQKISHKNSDLNIFFGRSIEIYNNQILISAIGEMYDENDLNPLKKAGAVYYYKDCTPTQFTDTLTSCDQLTWLDGITYTSNNNTAQYKITNTLGCDSIITLNLTIFPSQNITETQTACDSYTWNNQTYTQSGLYTYQTINANGCDSIATLELTIFQSSDENISHTACDAYIWNNQTYTQSGLYTFQTTNQYGCDSIISLDLTVNPSHQQTITHTTCDDYTWNGQTYNQSGVYTYITTNQFGCDSILTLDLTINNRIYFSETQTACDVYFWNNETYTQSGSYTYQTINGDGCDSIATLELTIFESNSNNIFQSACQSFEYENQILIESGIYTFNLQNSFGCDSIVTLELEILDQFTSQSISSCDQYIWPANGQTYLQSGVYIDTLQNIFGCDSVLQLDLKISPSFNIPDQKEVCDQFLWTPNNTTYTQSGFYQLDLKTAQGCDSILTLDLTIHPAFMQIDTVISTTEYTWQINNTTYATSGIYTEKWLTPADCDSIHQLLLTIKTDSDIYFPNIILPNSQNSNFTIFGSNSIELIQSLSIYDRWSNLVFHQENFPPNQASLGWNGKFRGQPVIPGVYVWTAQIKLSDGTTLMKLGDVTVVE